MTAELSTLRYAAYEADESALAANATADYKLSSLLGLVRAGANPSVIAEQRDHTEQAINKLHVRADKAVAAWQAVTANLTADDAHSKYLKQQAREARRYAIRARQLRCLLDMTPVA